MRNNAPLRELHVALVGMSGSGKSAIAVKYITKRFIGEYDSTLEDTYCREETVGGQCVMVWLMDTVENASRDEMRWIAWADVYIVVYDVTSQLSFQYAEGLLERIARHEHVLCAREHQPLLIGNKSDLERYRQVSESEGERLAAQHKAYFAECSAASDLRQFTKILHNTIQNYLSGARSPSPRLCSSDSEIVTPRKGAFSSLRSSSRSSQVRAKASKPLVQLQKTPSLIGGAGIELVPRTAYAHATRPAHFTAFLAFQKNNVDNRIDLLLRGAVTKDNQELIDKRLMSDSDRIMRQTIQFRRIATVASENTKHQGYTLVVAEASEELAAAKKLKSRGLRPLPRCCVVDPPPPADLLIRQLFTSR
ncbi:unnamed protein product [Caenorhabditis auriculariae]|uniref:small monomeric GTPase n=1 Tax=Caenorhabditis auriculariae TaxID=2777116 RepID=A0A8S1GN78_9PELO|nr:unnamed protein product [Caenorhabditis auriculariae]